MATRHLALGQNAFPPVVVINSAHENKMAYMWLPVLINVSAKLIKMQRLYNSQFS